MAVWSQINGLDCRKCSSQIKTIRGCVNEVPSYEVAGVKVNRCPLVVLGRKYDAYLLAHSFSGNGMLPFSGGWGDQPNALIEGILWIDSEQNRIGNNAERKC